MNDPILTDTSVSPLEKITKSYFSGNGYDSLFNRLYTQEGKDVYSMFDYELRTAQITNERNEVIFSQDNVEVPKSWSDTATKIVASKYFKRKNVGKEYGGNEDQSEQSVKRMVHRVSNTIRTFGEEKNYFSSKEEADTFEDELTYILLSQRAAFNSPVWFNLGLFHDYKIVENGGGYYWDEKTGTVQESKDSYSHPQLSACFINSVGDYMFGDHGPDDHSIFKLVETEAKLFKYGSGNGSNVSNIRAYKEKLSGGGESSGTKQFLQILDAGANAVKSGGKTRRAAKMVILNADHPDVEEFIDWKVDAERKARALAAFGYDSDMDGVYRDLPGQNSNNAIRVTDEFMNAVLEDKNWNLTERTTGNIRKTIKARELLEYIAKAAWVSGDPGMQYHTTINYWHTCPNTAPINASNPCSEYMFIDDTACNLASINLMKFRREDGTFDIEGFKHTVRIMFSAQEIEVDLAGYPTPSIAKNSYDFRPLGLGFANLGAYLMSNGIPYDSEEGFAIAGAITSIMTGEAYKQSAKIASRVGPFLEFEKNKEPYMKVMKQHQESHDRIPKIRSKINLEEMIKDGERNWEDVRNLTMEYGSRNSQATVLAPTGTIGFMMDCDTTGIEPDTALVKYKKMIGGGVMKLVNTTIPISLAKLGHNEDQIKDITTYIDQNDTIEGAPHLKKEHLPIFDCAFRPANGKRVISPTGHVRMMAAVQPFLSGAISKTVNMPEDWTAKNIYEIYIESWKKGLKAIAVYRDNAKLSQPLSLRKPNNLEDVLKRGEERPLPQITESMTIRTKIKDEQNIEHGVHIICGEYEDGTLGEIRVQMFEEGSTVQGLLDTLTVAWSKELRYGVPLEEIVARNRKPKFSPSGASNYPYMINFNSLPHLIWGIVGIEYLGVDGFVESTGEQTVKHRVKDPSELRVNKNKERLRFEYYLKQIKEIDKVMNTPLFGRKEVRDSQLSEENGGIQVIEDNGQKLEYTTEIKKRSNGETCPGCGFNIPGIAGCTHCSNCGKQIGGGCPS